MTEIKSSLEIAMERAAALAGDAPDRDIEENGRSKGVVIVRRALDDDLSTEDLRKILDGLDAQAAGFAVMEAVKGLSDKVAEKPDLTLPVLSDLIREAKPLQLVEEMKEQVQNLKKATVSVQMELMERMRDEYAERGISGSAVYPNPRSHPEYESIIQQAVSNMITELNILQEKLLECLNED